MQLQAIFANPSNKATQSAHGESSVLSLISQQALQHAMTPARAQAMIGSPSATPPVMVRANDASVNMVWATTMEAIARPQTTPPRMHAAGQTTLITPWTSALESSGKAAFATMQHAPSAGSAHMAIGMRRPSARGHSSSRLRSRCHCRCRSQCHSAWSPSSPGHGLCQGGGAVLARAASTEIERRRRHRERRLGDVSAFRKLNLQCV